MTKSLIPAILWVSETQVWYMKMADIEIPETVQILLFIENGEQCWTLNVEDVEKCKRRGYPYKIVEYTKRETR